MKHQGMVAMTLGGALAIVLLGMQTMPVRRGHPPELRRGAVERSLAAGDIVGAQRAWHDLYVQALDGEDWQTLLDAADTRVLIARRAGARPDNDPRVRELYLAALFRARAQGSLDGALRVAEGFAALGDRGAAAMALQLADTITPRQDGAAAAPANDTLD